MFSVQRTFVPVTFRTITLSLFDLNISFYTWCWCVISEHSFYEQHVFVGLHYETQFEFSHFIFCMWYVCFSSLAFFQLNSFDDFLKFHGEILSLRCSEHATANYQPQTVKVEHKRSRTRNVLSILGTEGRSEATTGGGRWEIAGPGFTWSGSCAWTSPNAIIVKGAVQQEESSRNYAHSIGRH